MEIPSNDDDEEYPASHVPVSTGVLLAPPGNEPPAPAILAYQGADGEVKVAGGEYESYPKNSYILPPKLSLSDD